MIKKIPIADVRIDGGTQHRDIDDTVVLRYKAIIEENPDQLPEIEVMFDGKSYWLVDGFHRLFAHRKLSKKYITADITEGTQRDAQFVSFRANAHHGFPRQRGVAKTILMTKIFPDKEWRGNTDAAIAEWVGGITRRYVGKCRGEFENLEKKCNSGQANTQNGTSSNSGQDESESDNDTENEDSAETEPEKTGKVIDSLGNEVPEHLKEVFSRVSEIKEKIKTINEIFKTCRDAQAKNDPLYVYCKVDSLKADIGNARRNLRFTIPFAICGYCGADVNNADCRACNGKGFINEAMYQAMPEEMK